jgi:hypothetical protein
LSRPPDPAVATGTTVAAVTTETTGLSSPVTDTRAA